MLSDIRTFPGGSRKRVTKAGNNVREGKATFDDLKAINEWRAAHRRVINSFQAILRGRTRDTDVIVAQRHKRRRTIVDKLRRYPAMQLGRMDDVAGCRLIFSNVAELHEFRDAFHKSRFKHTLKNHRDKYDYIENPKSSGYRGIHDVYAYNVNSDAGRHLKGLLIELQYRTQYQHAWATANELIGFLTTNQPKFGRGDVRYQQAMQLASEIIARSAEDMKSCYPNLSNEELVSQFVKVDGAIHLMERFRGINAADDIAKDKKNYIFIFGEGESGGEVLDIQAYEYATAALRALFELERDDPGKDIVLVRGDRPSDVRESFKNYFSDAVSFVDLVDEGCRRLVQGKWM